MHITVYRKSGITEDEVGMVSAHGRSSGSSTFSETLVRGICYLIAEYLLLLVEGALESSTPAPG